MQIDAGYIRSIPRGDGTRWFTAVASKLVLRGTPSTPAHAYVTVGYDPTQGMRQQAFLRSIGIGVAVPLTVLSDGGEDVDCACRIPSGVERVLDWYHIGMRFEHLRNAVRGLRGIDPTAKEQLGHRVDGAKWLLWHGRSDACLARLESVRREVGWGGVRNPLGRLVRYLRGCRGMLVNYRARYARGLPISSAGAESVVDYVIGQRIEAQWAHALES